MAVLSAGFGLSVSVVLTAAEVGLVGVQYDAGMSLPANTTLLLTQKVLLLLDLTHCCLYCLTAATVCHRPSRQQQQKRQ